MPASKPFLLSVLMLFVTIIEVYGGTVGFGINYFVGVPVGGPTGSGSVNWQGDTFSIKIKEGPDFKIGPGNIGAYSIFNITDFLGFEAGLEFHSGYNNERAVVIGRVYHDGVDEPLKETIEEDSVKASMLAFGCGARFGLPFKGRIRPFVDGGVLLSRTKLEGLELEGEIKEVYTEGTNLGVYTGGGVIVFLSERLALKIPAKYRLFFKNEQTLHVEWFGEKEKFNTNVKPIPVLSVGGGVEVYPF
jgi:hypothetical protein